MLVELPLARFRNEEKCANAPAGVLRDSGDFAKGKKNRALEVDGGGVGHDERPVRVFQLG